MRILRWRLALPALVTALTLVGAASASADAWREGAPMTTARANAGAALLGDDLYVIGGGGTSGPRALTEIYDTIGNIWRAAAAVPNGIEQFGIAVSDNKIYVAGGYVAVAKDADAKDTESAALWIYDAGIGVWVGGPAMPQTRVGFGLVAVGGKLYAIGGKGPQADRVFIFDPKAGGWSVAKAAMPSPRADAAFAVLDGSIYVIGGSDGRGPTGRVDIYDPVRDAWRSGAALPVPREGHSAAVLDGRIHVMGGQSLAPPKTFADHFVLDGAGWRKAAPLPTPGHGAVAVATHGKLYVIGGSPGAGVYTVFTQSDVVDIYSRDK